MIKINKGTRRRVLCLFFILIGIIGYTMYNTYEYWQEIMSNYKEKKILSSKYEKLIQNQDDLKSDLVRLQDPNYIATYAREKYLYSKDGELILKVIDENK